MKTIEIYALILKLFGLFLAVNYGGTALTYILNYFQYSDADFKGGVLMAIIFYMMVSALGLFLWFLPISVAKSFVPRSSDESYAEIGKSLAEWEKVAYTVIGVFVLSWAIPDLIYNASTIYIIESADVMMDQSKLRETYAYFLITIFEISIGLFLILGSEKLQKIIRRIRSA